MGYVNIQGRRLPFVFRYVSELVIYRHLVWNLVSSDLRARFRRSYFGVLWAIIQPLCFSLIIGYVWGTIFNYASVWDYALYIFSGVIVWDYFATVMNVSQDSLLAAEGYLKQTRIPFFIFQIRTALTGMVVLLFASVGLLIMLAAMNRLPTFGIHLLLIPAMIPVLFMFMAPLAVIMSILGTQLRDLKYITGLAVQALFFISPVMLGREVFDAPKMQLLNVINPMVSVLRMFREPLMESKVWSQDQFLTVLAWSAVFWVVAIFMSVRSGRRLVFSL
jgi:lipopolysaccharide transport system permease protein